MNKQNQKKNLLIVDDNQHYQEIIKKLVLQKNIYNIDTTISAQDALATIYHKNVPYSVIITDITMERQLSGIQMLFKLQNYIKNFSVKVVVASTGFDYQISIYLSILLFQTLRVRGLIPKKHLNNKKNLIYDLSDHNMKHIHDIL